MLSLYGDSRSRHVNGRGQRPVTRREIMRIGGLSALGLGLPQLYSHQAAAASDGGNADRVFGKAKNCIVLFLMGGPPQHSTWDPKPLAPEQIRGAINPIATNVPGIQVGELMPNLAKQADKLCVIRSVSTRDNAHSSSGYYMLTGRPHAPPNTENAKPGAPNDWPCLGALVQYARPTTGAMPTSIRMPMHIFNTDGSVWPGQDSGFLRKKADPWLLRCEPAAPKFSVPELALPGDFSDVRLQQRQSLLDRLDEQLRGVDTSGTLEQYDRDQQRVFDLLRSTSTGKAFQLSEERPELRERYGSSQFGQSVLLARRLIEAGTKLVQVNWYRGPDEPKDNPCWDSHTDETNRLKKVLIPPWDQAHAALLTDLAERGMLDETLVVCMAEFGRTPKFNSRGGRDHWGSVFSVALAGAGIRGGNVIGSSDAIGGQPASGLVQPQDLTASILHMLGIPPHRELHDPVGRPFPLTNGDIIPGLF